MLDTFDVGFPTGGWHYDAALGKDVQTLDPIVADLKGRVKVVAGLDASDSEVGGRTAVTVTRVLNIPVSSPAIPAGAIAVCKAAHETSDPTLLGARLRLDGPAPGSQTTARRLQVTEVIS